jgi:hypothetical protein
MRVWFAACPRCQGDLIEARETDGKVVACLTCSHELNSIEERYLRRRGHLPSLMPRQVAPKHGAFAKEGYRQIKLRPVAEAV